MENINDYLIKNINKFIGSSVIIEGKGFIESKFFIEKMNFSINYDILSVLDEKSENFLRINLNQIYNLDADSKEIEIFLDNDTIITIKVDDMKK